METVQIYLHVNKEIYDTDESRIAFALSFMKQGSAKTWASTIIKEALKTTTPNFGTFPTFVAKFQAAFIHADVESEARDWLVSAHVSKELTLENYITEFKNHVALSGATEEKMLIDLFASGIQPALMTQILSMDTIPTTLNEWYTKAAHFKSRWD